MTENPHCSLIPDRLVIPTQWRCTYCAQQGTWAEMDEPEALATGTVYKVCTYAYPPCSWCGQTPLCAPDCVGIRVALSDPKVYTIGDTKEEKP